MPLIKFVWPDGRDSTVTAETGWSVMESALNAGIDGILADCGGAAACATCHVYVDGAWIDRLSAPSETETDMLGCVVEQRPTSRLSCQIRVTPELDGLCVEVPEEQG